MTIDQTIGNYLNLIPESRFNLTELVEKGLPTETLTSLRDKGLTASEIAEIVIPPRMLKLRNARRELLSPEETDRLVRVARIAVLAETIFGNRDKALLWLRGHDDRIGGRSPLSLLQTEAGGRLVESMLWQIDEGIYS